LRQLFAEGRLTLASLEVISGMPRLAQVRIAFLMEKIRLSASLQKKLLGLLEDLGALSEHPPGALLDSPEIESAINDARLSPFQKGEKVYDFLYRLRNPRLSAARNDLPLKRNCFGCRGRSGSPRTRFSRNPDCGLSSRRMIPSASANWLRRCSRRLNPST